MTRASVIAAIAVLFASQLAAASPPKTAALPFPAGTSTTGFAVCGPGLGLVPVNGGVVAAGFEEWLLPPGLLGITGIACDAQARLFVMLRGELLVAFRGITNGTVQPLAKLPGDKFQIAGNSGDYGIVLYGRGHDGVASIFSFDRGHGLQPVWRGQLPVRTASVVAPGVVIAVIGRDLVLFRGTSPLRLMRVPDAVDGVASDSRGDVYLSAGNRILHLRGHAPTRVLATGIHGPLRVVGNALYVEDREQHRLVRILMEDT